MTIAALKAGLGPRKRPPDAGSERVLTTRLAGLALPNPIGLAAGFDKNAEVARPMLAARLRLRGVRHARRPGPQTGNPRPRLFRLAEDAAVINRLGFNNQGLEAFAAHLSDTRPSLGPRTGAVGANIGANKDSADRVGDYVAGLKRLWGLADYFTLNISSPNTPGLRALQTGEALAELLDAVRAARIELSARGAAPLFLKVAPDLTETEITDIVDAAVSYGLDGIVVTNTTLARPAGLHGRSRGEAGGLSGVPLMEPSTRVLRAFHDAAQGRLVLIGAGGVADGSEAMASNLGPGRPVVQLLYRHDLRRTGAWPSPSPVHLAARLRAEGFANVAEAVGAR